MATFRDNGLELNVKNNIGEFSTPTGNRFTIFASNSVSPSGRYFKQETGQQLWMVDSSGALHEISNEWLESRVENTSAKLDYIYPAVTAFMSAGLVFRNSSEVQTISSDLNIIGMVSISGSTSLSGISTFSGSLITDENCFTSFNSDISAFSDVSSFTNFRFNKLSTNDTLENITPFFIRSSANRLQPEGWSDPALLIVGNEKIYNMFKPTDRGLRFTVLNRETLQLVHDEVYDTAGSQYRVTDLALKMFTLMNDTKNVGILNSREDWESLIWRKLTVESVGISASSINSNYSNLKIGSLLDQFERFGLLKAIRAAGKHSEMYPDQAASQYCAIFEGSDFYVDTSGASAIVYPTNRAVESWIPRVSNNLPVGGEQQRAQLTGWFVQPRQLDITENINDRSASFVAYPMGHENDAVREVVFVNKNGDAAEFNARISNTDVNVLKTTFSSPSGMWHLIGDVTIEADTLDITGYTSHVGQINLTDHKIINLEYADINEPGNAVNVEFTRIVTPVGSVLDYGGKVAPSNWLISDGSAVTISGFDKLFNIIGFNYGMMSNITISGSPTIVSGRTYVAISGVIMLLTDTLIFRNGVMVLMTGQVSTSGSSQFVSGYVSNISGTPTFVSGTSSDVTGNVYNFLLPLASGRTSIAAGQATIIDISGGNILFTYQVGEVGGESRHVLTIPEMPSHTHDIVPRQDFAAAGGGFNSFSNNIPLTPTSSTGGNLSHNNMQPYIVFNKIIRYK
jgi:microcystin-dependent protein